MGTTPTFEQYVTKVLDMDSRRRSSGEAQGIEVREEEMVAIEAQLVYRMRCECSRAWFDVQLPKIVECPACGKIGAVIL